MNRLQWLSVYLVVYFMSFCSWEAKRLISLAIPVFLAQVTLILMTVVDTVMAGQVSATDLAALSIATYLESVNACTARHIIGVNGYHSAVCWFKR